MNSKLLFVARGTYTIGTFETAADAEQAIKDVLEARWNG